MIESRSNRPALPSARTWTNGAVVVVAVAVLVTLAWVVLRLGQPVPVGQLADGTPYGQGRGAIVEMKPFGAPTEMLSTPDGERLVLLDGGELVVLDAALDEIWRGSTGDEHDDSATRNLATSEDGMSAYFAMGGGSENITRVSVVSGLDTDPRIQSVEFLGGIGARPNPRVDGIAAAARGDQLYVLDAANGELGVYRTDPLSWIRNIDLSAIEPRYGDVLRLHGAYPGSDLLLLESETALLAFDPAIDMVVNSRPLEHEKVGAVDHGRGLVVVSGRAIEIWNARSLASGQRFDFDFGGSGSRAVPSAGVLPGNVAVRGEAAVLGVEGELRLLPPEGTSVPVAVIARADEVVIGEDYRHVYLVDRTARTVTRVDVGRTVADQEWMVVGLVALWALAGASVVVAFRRRRSRGREGSMA